MAAGLGKPKKLTTLEKSKMDWNACVVIMSCFGGDAQALSLRRQPFVDGGSVGRCGARKKSQRRIPREERLSAASRRRQGATS